MRLNEEVQRNFLQYTSHFDRRAFAAYNDGLLPLYRRLLYTSYNLNLGSRYVKAAKVVGDVLGNYHPHGDGAVYAGLIQLTCNEAISHCLEPMFEAQGNIGNPYSFDASCRNAAAMRYVEVKLTKYATEMLLDKEYMAQVPMVPNFDGTTTEPRFLPAKLPNILINGSFGIGGINRSLVPSFGTDSVVSLLRWLLTNPDATDEDIAEQFSKMPYRYRYGGVGNISAEQALSDSFSVNLTPHWVERSGKKKVLSFYGLPGITSTLDKILKKVYALDGTRAVTDNSDPHAKVPVPMLVDVLMHDDCAHPEHWEAAVVAAFSETARVTPRLCRKSAVRKFSLVSLLREWLGFRLALETKVLSARIADYRKSLAREELKLLVTTPEVLKKLPKLFELDKDGQVDYLKSLCGISDDDAKYILSLSFSQLTKSDQTGGRRSAENFRKQIATNERLLRNPATAVAKAL